MTLIVGFAHQDFALLFADKRAITSGPTQIKAGNITINTNQPVHITGFKKITVNSDSSAVIGISGDANQHSYLNQFEISPDSDSALNVIENFLSPFSSYIRKPISTVAQLMTRESAVSIIYDKTVSRFFLLKFQVNDNYLEKEIVSPLSTHFVLRYVGSGAIPFTQLSSLPVVGTTFNDFSASGKGKGLAEIQELIEQVKKLYDAISCVEPSVSKEVEIWQAIKTNPSFQKV